MKENSAGGISFLGALLLVFIVLKLTHVINWSWFWVLSPLWIEAIIFVAILLLVFIPWRKKTKRGDEAE